MKDLSEKSAFSKQKLVIFCDPNRPIYFLESFLRLVSPHLGIAVSTHVHSTVKQLPAELASFCRNFSNVETSHADISVTFIWKSVGIDPVMLSRGMHEIRGTANIARYLNRLIESINANLLKYERNGPRYANEIDSYLDKIHCSLYNGNIEALRKMRKKSSRYVMGDSISIIDLILESVDE